MKPKFIDRVKELDFLEKKYQQSGLQLIIIYGRRRVGKTELITKFTENKRHIYFLVNKRGTLANANRLAEKASKFFNDIKPEVKDFDDVFKYILKRVDNEKFVVIIDEFSYLIETDPAITSVFQIIVDELLKKNNLMLILCGSSISMMERGVLSYQSPLYGRRTGQWRVNPLPVKEIIRFFPNKELKDIIEFYTVAGDIPAYLVKLDSEKGIFQNIKEEILTKGEFLYDEGENMLRQELKEPATYLDILEAMTKTSKHGEIANFARINAKDLPKYIINLQKIDMIEKLQLITEKKPKKSLYIIKDNFTEFWFKFVYPNKSELEEGRVDYVLEGIQNKFNQQAGKCFERFCLSLIKENLINLPFSFDKLGKQWGKFKGEKGRNTYEIDIVALNEQSKDIMFCECKWQNNVNAEKVLNELREKAKHVEWPNKEEKEKRKEHYAIFAKSFKDKTKIKKIKKSQEKNIFLFDLKDIEKILKTKK